MCFKLPPRVQLLLLHFISLRVLSESLHHANLLLTCVVSFWTVGFGWFSGGSHWQVARCFMGYVRENEYGVNSVSVCGIGVLVKLRISPLCALAAQCPLQTSGANSPPHLATIEEAAQRSSSSLLGGGSTCWHSASLATRRPLASQTQKPRHMFLDVTHNPRPLLQSMLGSTKNFSSCIHMHGTNSRFGQTKTKRKRCTLVTWLRRSSRNLRRRHGRTLTSTPDSAEAQRAMYKQSRVVPPAARRSRPHLER